MKPTKRGQIITTATVRRGTTRSRDYQQKMLSKGGFYYHSSALGWKIKYLTFSVWWLDVEKEKVEKEFKDLRHSSFFSTKFSQLGKSK